MQSIRQGKTGHISQIAISQIEALSVLVIGESEVETGLHSVNSLHTRYNALEQHSNNSMSSTSELQSLTHHAVEKNLKSPPAQSNVSVTESIPRNPEASDTLVAPTLEDMIDNLPVDVDEALLVSNLQFTCQDVHYVSANDRMFTPELDPLSSVDTTPSQGFVPYSVTMSPSNAPSLSPDFEIVTPSFCNPQFQEVNLLPPSMSQVSSCVPSSQSPSGAAGSVLVLENLDDETRDAVLQLIWSKRRHMTLRLE